MATKSNGNWRIAGFILTSATILVAIVLAWGDQKGELKAQGTASGLHVAIDAKRHVDLKKDGCDPSQANTTEIAVIKTIIKTELPAIKQDIRELRVEQKADTQLILEEIRKNK